MYTPRSLADSTAITVLPINVYQTCIVRVNQVNISDDNDIKVIQKPLKHDIVIEPPRKF